MTVSNVRDTRTLQQLAQEALDVQDASNLAGVLYSWHKNYCRLRELLNNSEFAARDDVITGAYLSKVRDMLWRIESNPLVAILDSVDHRAKGESGYA